MAKVNTPQELFVALLSNVMRREEKMGDIMTLIAGKAQDADIKQALESREYVREQQVMALDRCFKLLGVEPTEPETRLHEIFVEDFKKQVAAIEGPVAKRLFVLAKINNLMRLHANEYAVLAAMADLTNNYGVAVLLEACQATNDALADRARDAIRSTVRERIAERRATK
jgi:ferritin-like metal-binding protein YciE